MAANSVALPIYTTQPSPAAPLTSSCMLYHHHHSHNPSYLPSTICSSLTIHQYPHHFSWPKHFSINDGCPISQMLPIRNSMQNLRAARFTSPLTPTISVYEKEVFHPQECKEKMEEMIQEIKLMFKSMKDGEISVSAYDTAWVARVPSLDDPLLPQFPMCLQWVIQNQLADGSWGIPDAFHVFDRILNTIACLVALKTWNAGYLKIKKGIEFVWSNMEKMEQGRMIEMPIALEITLPALLEDAREVGLHLPYNASALKTIQQERDKKMKRIPLDTLHKEPTSLLFSVEGLHRMVNWNKLVSLQQKNGSLLFSPAATACALKYTGDLKCLQYLNSVLRKFGNAVPNVYPVDLFERLWIVDRLQRLGISRYFQSELRECLDYVYGHFSASNGICWASEASFQDIDDTSMGFRLLRLNGYEVSPDVFQQFSKDDEFFSIPGQTSEAVTGMFNFYRACQISFLGETILEKGAAFARKFFERKQKENNVFDKWVITKGLKGEVDYALKIPFHASLPRIETKEYLSQYGPDDIWIGKAFYKMLNINNQTFLELAKADFKLCQSLHQEELNKVLRWNDECQFDQFFDLNSGEKIAEHYFSIAANSFEPELASVRLVCTKCFVLTTVLHSFFNRSSSLQEQHAFVEAMESWDDGALEGWSPDARILFKSLYDTVMTIGHEASLIQGREVIGHLRDCWMRWTIAIMEEAKWRWSSYIPSQQEYMDVATQTIGLEPVIISSLFFVGPKIGSEIFYHEHYKRLTHLVNIIGRLLNDIQSYKKYSSLRCSIVSIYMQENPKEREEDAIEYLKSIVDKSMQQLICEVLRPSCIPRRCKEIHLHMAKVFQYFYAQSHTHERAIDVIRTVHQVLFEKVI